MVGFLMFGAISDIKFTDDNMTEAVPAYLCIIAMPLFYSISEKDLYRDHLLCDLECSLW